MNKERNIIIAKNIRRFLNDSNMSQKKLAELINIKPSTLSDYLNLRSNPSHGVIQRIADVFEVGKSDIDTTYKDDNDITSIYNKLQPSRQQKVLAYANKQLGEQERRDKSNKISSIEEYKIKYNNNRTESEKIAFPRIGSTGAGIGEDLYDDIIEETVYFDRNEVDEELLETADFCIYVNGDSMEPAIKRDTYSFVRKTIEIRDGLVALIIYDGTVLIKKIEITEGSVNLVSLNPKYETIRVEPHHQFKLIGKIVQ